MLLGRIFLEFVSGKLWNSTRNLRFGFTCYIFVFTLGFVVSTQLFQGLDQNPVNPGIGVNYYGKAQHTTTKTLSTGLTLNDIFDDFVPRDCSKAPNNTSCIQQNQFYQDPDFTYTVVHQIPCDISSPYRNIDGTCISPHLPVLGMANDCYFRFTPQYYDGFGGFRKSVKGRSLPEPRDISVKIFRDRHRPESNVSFQFLTFGQLIAHDLSRAVQPQTDCCSPANAEKEECRPISVRPNDPFYSQFNKTCIDFKRSDKCTFGKTLNREQKNGATAALDGSIIYGVTENKVNSLRAFDGTGRLNFTDRNRFNLLPTGKDPEDIFCPKMQESKCFVAGDPRINQHASLTGFQTVWMREHNRLAEIFKDMNPQWGEEKLFQEARKLVIAEFQCITYQDFLPILLTPRIIKEFDIAIKKGSSGTLFNPIAVIAVWHDWAHAAFRLHSAVPSHIGALHLRFKDTFSNPELIRHGHTSDLIKGSQRVPTEKYDRYMITDLSDHLTQQPGLPYGKDLVSINIQRGRDHGIAPYVEIVKFCSERTINITTFDQLVEFAIMPEKNVRLLKRIYGSVLDVDMWVGMQLENHMEGTILGPSAICVCAKQFYFTQKGDRLFFNHEGLLAPFTDDKRSAIKDITLGRILCDNTKIKHIQKNPFKLPSADNPMISCEEFPKIDLSFWKEC